MVKWRGCFSSVLLKGGQQGRRCLSITESSVNLWFMKIASFVTYDLKRKKWLIGPTYPLQCILTKKKYFHKLESDSARNNIHPNNKQKPEITNKNTGKNDMSIWPASLSVKVVSKLMSWFSPSFSGFLINATVLTLLLESFAGKKTFLSWRFS